MNTTALAVLLATLPCPPSGPPDPPPVAWAAFPGSTTTLYSHTAIFNHRAWVGSRSITVVAHERATAEGEWLARRTSTRPTRSPHGPGATAVE